MMLTMRRVVVARGTRVLATIPYPAIAPSPRRDQLRCVAVILISLRIAHASDSVGPQARNIGQLVGLAAQATMHTHLARSHAMSHGLAEWVQANLADRVHHQADRMAMRMLDALEADA